MPSYVISDTALEIHLNTIDKISMLHLSFSVPLSSIRGATEDPGALPSELGFRAPGTGFPWVIAAGTFYKSLQRQFVAWYRGQVPVVVELQNHKFSRLILGSDDARSFAEAINLAIAKR